jgi:hypothetical protein
VQCLLFLAPFLGTDGPCRLDGSRCRFAFRLQLLGLTAVELEDAPTLRRTIQHFPGHAASVDLVVMDAPGEAFEDAEQVLVPGTAQDLYIASVFGAQPTILAMSSWGIPRPARRRTLSRSASLRTKAGLAMAGSRVKPISFCHDS